MPTFRNGNQYSQGSKSVIWDEIRNFFAFDSAKEKNQQKTKNPLWPNALRSQMNTEYMARSIRSFD